MYPRLLERLAQPLAIRESNLKVGLEGILPSLLAGKLTKEAKTVKAGAGTSGGSPAIGGTLPTNVGRVDITDTLLHKEISFASGGTSYQGIAKSVEAHALGGKDTILFYADSGGGEVSGLFETVKQLQDLQDSYNLSYVGVVDTVAASACYALLYV